MADPDDQLVGTLADESAAMQKGKGGALVAMGALALVLIGGVVMLMGGDDERRVYGEIGKHVNGIRKARFDRFWGCALKGEDLRSIKSNQDVADQLKVRGREGGKAYALNVRDKCLPDLTKIGPDLTALIVPAELQADVDGMKEANERLRSGFSGYITYLIDVGDDDQLKFEEDKARPDIKTVAKAWYDFRKAHGSINKLIKVKVE